MGVAIMIESLCPRDYRMQFAIAQELVAVLLTYSLLGRI
jgi:hypothetical protein